MIDTDKYEGHTPAPWTFKGPQGLDLENGTHAVVSLYDDPRMREGGEADMKLIADAPLLLAEVKRLREQVKDLQTTVDAQSVIVHDYNEQQSELNSLRKMMIDSSNTLTGGDHHD